MFKLESVMPWGRSLDEYRRMFALSDDDLSARILGCGDGPASFNAELTALGGRVTSFDPLYQFSRQQISQRIDESFDVIIAQTIANKHEFVWDERIPNIRTLAKTRSNSMQAFLEDFDEGLAASRYVAAELPMLEFADQQFDLALCSHFLFLYSEQLSRDFHVQSVREMCRVANEVRIFPLLELGSKKSRHVDAVAKTLSQDGFGVEVINVDYEFQRDGNEMMRVTAQKM